jgi:hypothetical protein
MRRRLDRWCCTLRRPRMDVDDAGPDFSCQAQWLLEETGMRQSDTKRSNLARWTAAPVHQRFMVATLLALTACSDAGGDATTSGAEADQREGGADAGTSVRAGRTGGKAGQGGKPATPSGGSSGKGGSRADAASKSAESRAVSVPEERVLAIGCAFTASDWRIGDSEQLLVSCDNKLGLIPLSGEFVELASASAPSDIALSSSRLLYTSTMQLFAAPLSGGAPTTLAINVIDGLQYSSDRSVAVFERAQNSEGQIPIIAVDTKGKAGEDRQLVLAGTRGTSLSPNGNHLLYSPDFGELALVDVQDQSRTSLLGKGSISGAVWSASGQKLAFFNSESKRVVLAKADGSMVQLGDPFSQQPETIEFIPDESGVVVADNDYGFAKSRTVILNADGKTDEIAKGKSCELNSISRAGSVLTTQHADDQSSPELWLRTSNGTNMMLGTLERCAAFGKSPVNALTEDGARVAFIDVHGSFVVVDFDTGAPVVETMNVITVGAACFAAPTWSSDGSKVLLTSCKDEGYDCSVVVMEAATGKKGPTLGPDRAESAAFSKDASYIAYANTSDEVSVYSTSGGPQLWNAYIGSSDVAQFHWLDSRRFVVATWAADRELRLITLP